MSCRTNAPAPRLRRPPLALTTATPALTIPRMPQTVPAGEPARVTAGDTATWTRSLPDFPATDGWVLSYALVRTGVLLGITASAQGADHLVSVAAATTAAWQPGRYAWQASVARGAERHTIGTGYLEVLPDFAAQAGGHDGRSHARRVLEAVEAVIEGRASQAHAEYAIAGRQLKFIPIPELLALRDRYRAEVRAQDVAAGLRAAPRINVRL